MTIPGCTALSLAAQASSSSSESSASKLGLGPAGTGHIIVTVIAAPGSRRGPAAGLTRRRVRVTGGPGPGQDCNSGLKGQVPAGARRARATGAACQSRPVMGPSQTVRLSSSRRARSLQLNQIYQLFDDD